MESQKLSIWKILCIKNIFLQIKPHKMHFVMTNIS